MDLLVPAKEQHQTNSELSHDWIENVNESKGLKNINMKQKWMQRHISMTVMLGFCFLVPEFSVLIMNRLLKKVMTIRDMET